MPRNREEADLFFCSVTPLQNVRNENLVYGTIARPLRPSPESGFLLMAEARLQRVGSLPSLIAFVAQATHPAGALLRDRQPAA